MTGLDRDTHLIRLNCLLDLYYLAYNVLGYKQLSPRLHRPLCNVVQAANLHVIRQIPQDATHCPIISYGDLIADVFDSHSGGGEGGQQARSSSGKIAENLEGARHLDTWLSSWYGVDSETRAALSKYEQKDGIVVDEARERMFLMFRGSFKTTLITIAHTIQLMLLWPDIRILIQSHKKEGGSQEILHAIKRHFIGNDRLRKLFPEYAPKPNSLGMVEWGTSEKVTLINRHPSCAWPESTIEIAGATTDVTGRHYDYIKNDDLVTRDSITNETQIQKTRQLKSLQKFLFNQPEWGITDNIGTPYHFNDLYSTLRKAKGITRVIVPALNHDNKPTFPERFTYEGLMAIRDDATMGSYEFSCQYMMNPVPPEDQTFRPEWLEREGFFYDKLPSNLKYYIFVDPAAKRRKQSDYTALITLGVDERGTLYLVDAIRDKLSPEGRTNLAIEIAKRHGIHKIHYETVGFQDTDAFIINRKAREMDYYITVSESKASGGSKEDRIRGLQPLYERADIRWPKKYEYYSQYEKRRIDMIEVLRDEMLMFPKAEHDDLLDAHSQLLQTTLFKPQSVKEVDNQQDEFMWWRKQAIAYNKEPEHKVGQFKRKPRFVELPSRVSWK